MAKEEPLKELSNKVNQKLENREIQRNITELSSVIEELRHKTSEAQKLAEKIGELRKKRIQLENDIISFWKKNDLMSPGNIGYEHRILNFLMSLELVNPEDE